MYCVRWDKQQTREHTLDRYLKIPIAMLKHKIRWTFICCINKATVDLFLTQYKHFRLYRILLTQIIRYSKPFNVFYR